MSWDLVHDTNPKSFKGRPDREVMLGKPHYHNPLIPRRLIDKTIDLVAMTGRQKGHVLGIRRTPAREHRHISSIFEGRSLRLPSDDRDIARQRPMQTK
jgi:hypothetical protein